MALKGNVNDLRKLTQRLKKAPVELARAVAAQAAPPLTTLSQSAYDAGQTVYGNPRPLGKDGKPLDLVRTGATRSYMKFVTTGTIIRCRIGPDYSRFLIGKYRILPMGEMPVKWATTMANIVAVQKVPL